MWNESIFFMIQFFHNRWRMQNEREKIEMVVARVLESIYTEGGIQCKMESIVQASPSVTASKKFGFSVLLGAGGGVGYSFSNDEILMWHLFLWKEIRREV